MSPPVTATTTLPSLPSTTNSETAYTTIISVIPGIGFIPSGTTFITWGETATFTITDPIYYNSLVGYEAVTVTVSSTSDYTAPTESMKGVDGGAEGLPSGAVAGIVVSCVVAVMVVVVGVGWGLLKRRKKKLTSKESGEAEEGKLEREGTCEEEMDDDGFWAGMGRKAGLDGNGVESKDGKCEGHEGLLDGGERYEMGTEGDEGLRKGKGRARSIEGLAELAG